MDVRIWGATALRELHEQQYLRALDDHRNQEHYLEGHSGEWSDRRCDAKRDRNSHAEIRPIEAHRALVIRGALCLQGVSWPRPQMVNATVDGSGVFAIHSALDDASTVPAVSGP
jgi:hypothetical protein